MFLLIRLPLKHLQNYCPHYLHPRKFGLYLTWKWLVQGIYPQHFIKFYFIICEIVEHLQCQNFYHDDNACLFSSVFFSILIQFCSSCLTFLLLSFRSCKQVQKLNKSVWNVNSAISSSALLESAHALQLMVYPLTLFFKMFESFSW